MGGDCFGAFGEYRVDFPACCSIRRSSRPFDNKNFSEIDAAIVATHLMLAVQDEGLGTTWVGYFDAPKLQQLFPEMQDHELIAVFPIGYPADDATPADRHNQRKAKEELVRYL